MQIIKRRVARNAAAHRFPQVSELLKAEPAPRLPLRSGPLAGSLFLAFASAGRLHGQIAEERDLFDMFEFQRAATDLPGAMITLYSAGALHNDHVSPDLTAATPL